jgi:hypothetical protein
VAVAGVKRVSFSSHKEKDRTGTDDGIKVALNGLPPAQGINIPLLYGGRKAV